MFLIVLQQHKFEGGKMDILNSEMTCSDTCYMMWQNPEILIYETRESGEHGLGTAKRVIKREDSRGK